MLLASVTQTNTIDATKVPHSGDVQHKVIEGTIAFSARPNAGLPLRGTGRLSS